MKTIAAVASIAFLLQAPLAQASDMKGMKMDKPSHSEAKGDKNHKGSGTVRRIDKAAGTVTLNHGPIKSMDWPSMTMAFKVKDKSVLDKLTASQKVEFEFHAEGKDHVITSIK